MHTESSLSLHRKPRIVLLEKIFFATLNIFATPPLHNQNLNIKLFVIHDEEMRYSEWSPPSPPLSPSTMHMCASSPADDDIQTPGTCDDIPGVPGSWSPLGCRLRW